MPTYSFQMSAGLAGSSVSVTAVGSSTAVASGTLDTNALFTASLPVGDYVATAAGGHYSYSSAGTVAQSDPDQLSDLNSTFARRVGGSVVLLGDSITAQSSEAAGVNDPDSAASNYMLRNTGYFGWAQTLMGHRFRLLRNSGVSGERTDQIRARIASQVTAYAPEWCIVLAGTNDVLQSISEATVKANLGGIYDDLLAAGIRVIACTIPPNSAATTTAQKQTLHGANAYIRDYARSHPGMVVVDWHAALADANTGAPIANSTADGTHPSALGGWLLGRVMADALDKVIPPTLTLIGSNADPYTKLTNGRMNGTAGSLPAGMTGSAADSWTYAWEGAAGTATLSKVPRTDGIQGQWQQIQLTGTAGTFRMFQQVTTLSTWGLAVGDKVQAEIEFEADADWNVTRFGLDIEWFNGGVGGVSALHHTSSTYGNLNPRKGILRTPVGIVPPSAARLQMFLRFFGTAGTLRVDRARLVKVP